jgi:hypothetical protein
MAPVVRIEPNGSQTLLMCDDAREDFKGQGWLVFLEKFQGFNLRTAKEFSLSFDGSQAKVGDIKVKVTEEFLGQATGIPLSGKKWFKNAKVEEVSWSLFFTSRKINCCDKGMPMSLLKTQWHGLLAVLKQFVMCEGLFGFVFLYHIRLLMNFIGFQLNIPYYLWRSLYKMAKRYKRQQLDSSLFHHGLIKILLVHQLKLQNDEWNTFLTRNGFVNSNIVEIEKPMIEETIIPARAVPSSTEAYVTASLSELIPDPKVVEQSHEQHTHSNASAKNGNWSMCKPSKSGIDLGFKNKKAGRLISRKLQNKPNPHVSSIKMIEIHERSDSEIERFLVEEDPPSLKIGLDQAYNSVDNLPPCLKHSKGFRGIKFDKKSIGNGGDIPTHDNGYSQAVVTDSQCEICLFWIDKYYTDIPILQSQIKTLTVQVDSLMD